MRYSISERARERASYYARNEHGLEMVCHFYDKAKGKYKLIWLRVAKRFKKEKEKRYYEI